MRHAALVGHNRPGHLHPDPDPEDSAYLLALGLAQLVQVALRPLGQRRQVAERLLRRRRQRPVTLAALAETLKIARNAGQRRR